MGGSAPRSVNVDAPHEHVRPWPAYGLEERSQRTRLQSGAHAPDAPGPAVFQGLAIYLAFLLSFIVRVARSIVVIACGCSAAVPSSNPVDDILRSFVPSFLRSCVPAFLRSSSPRFLVSLVETRRQLLLRFFLVAVRASLMAATTTPARRCAANPSQAIMGRAMPFHDMPFEPSMPCHAVTCHARPLHTTPYCLVHAISRHAIPHHSMPSHAVPFHAMPGSSPRRRGSHAIPSQAISGHLMSSHTMLCHAGHAMPCQASPGYAMTCHTMPCQAMP